MEEIARNFFELAYTDPFYRIVLASTAALLGLVGLFALLAIALRIRHDRRERRRRRLEARWESILMDVIEGRAEQDALLAIVARRDRVFYLDLLYRLGRHLQGEDLEIVREAARPHLSVLTTGLTRHDVETRAKYLQILGVLGFREDHDVILKALEDPSPMVAMVAARALMRRGRHQYAGQLLRRIGRFEDWSESTLASLLAVMGSGAAPELRRVFGDAEQPTWVRVTVCRALEKLNDFEAADVAAKVIAEAPDPETLRRDRARLRAQSDLLRSALALLGSVGRDEHIPLVRSYCNVPEETIRMSAIGALGRLSASSDTEALLLSIGDDSPWVAMNAARSLKHLARTDLLREMAASGHERGELLEQVLLESSRTP